MSEENGLTEEGKTVADIVAAFRFESSPSAEKNGEDTASEKTPIQWHLICGSNTDEALVALNDL